jgi:hypothetical protein
MKAYVGQTGRSFIIRYNEHTHSEITATLPGLHNISLNTHILSVLSTTLCRYYITKRKVLTSTQSNIFTFMLNMPPITT